MVTRFPWKNSRGTELSKKENSKEEIYRYTYLTLETCSKTLNVSLNQIQQRKKYTNIAKELRKSFVYWHIIKGTWFKNLAMSKVTKENHPSPFYQPYPAQLSKPTNYNAVSKGQLCPSPALL